MDENMFTVWVLQEHIVMYTLFKQTHSSGNSAFTTAIAVNLSISSAAQGKGIDITSLLDIKQGLFKKVSRCCS